MRKRKKCIKKGFKCLILLILMIAIKGNVTAKEKVCFTEKYIFEKETYFDYVLTVSEDSQIAGITIEIQFDTKQLKLVESDVGEVFQPTMSKINNKIDGKVILTAISTDVVMEKGDVLNLGFEILDSTKKDIEIKCIISECIDQNCDNLSITLDSTKAENPLYKFSEENNKETEGSKEVINDGSENIGKTQGQNGKTLSEDTQSEDVKIKENNQESYPEQKESKEEYHEEIQSETAKDRSDSKKIERNFILLQAIIFISIGVTILFLATWFIRRKKK